MENCLAVSYKVKHTFTQGPANPLLGTYSREIKHIHTKTYRIHSSFFIIVKILETPKRQMDKQIVVYLYNGILLSNNREQATNIVNNMEKSQNHFERLEQKIF